MNEVSIRTLNQETSKVLARVKRGEEINLTERGKVIARIIPASAGPLDSLISTGSVQPARVMARRLGPQFRCAAVSTRERCWSACAPRSGTSA